MDIKFKKKGRGEGKAGASLDQMVEDDNIISVIPYHGIPFYYFIGSMYHDCRYGPYRFEKQIAKAAEKRDAGKDVSVILV